MTPPLLRNLWIPVFGDGFWLAIGLAVAAAGVRVVGMLGPQGLFWVLPVGIPPGAPTAFARART